MFYPNALAACCLLSFMFFFFSSRRRHTRCLSDWSSDVCSSDLVVFSTGAGKPRGGVAIGDEILDLTQACVAGLFSGEALTAAEAATGPVRSEERRVGKEWRCRWWEEDEREKKCRAAGTRL